MALVDTPRRPSADADTVETVRRPDAEPEHARAATAAVAPEPVAHDDALRPGERIGRYHILEVIGRGGMGTVYSAFDPALERRVAIKILHRGRDGASSERERLLTEAKAMAQLSHPHVVTVHEAAVDRGLVFLAMEYVPGRTARAWLAQKDRTWREIVAVYRQAALGLAAAHAAEIIHRDVKADNILVGNDERVRITDFGIAVGLVQASGPRSGDELGPSGDGIDASERLTVTTGTPVYMSPEQLRGDPVDARSDQFSFAVTLFEALCRRRPFEGRTPSELKAAHRSGTIALPEVGVPAWLRKVLVRALEIDPDRRWPSMQALVKQLDLGVSPMRRPLQRWLLVLVPAGVVGGAILGGRVAGDPVGCEEAGAMAQIWDDDQRTRVTGALETAGPAFAGNTARTVVKLLDAYGVEWTSAYEDACWQHRAGVESDSLFDRRQACLRARHRAVASLVDILDDADRETMRNAIAAVDALPRVRECDAAHLVDDATWTVPDDPARRADHEAMLDALSQVQAMFRAGRFRDGAAQADDAVATARGLGDEALLIRALLLRGGFEEKLDRLEPAAASIEEAWHLALRTGNTIDAVRAAIRQIELVGYVLRNESVAIARVGDAHSLIERLRSRNPELATELEAAVLRAHGVVELRFSRPGAVDRLAQALAMVRGLPERHDLEIVDYLRALANAEFPRQRHDEALGHYQEALDLAAGVLGPDHPDVAALHNNIGLLLRNMGRAPEGAVHLETALRISLAAFGPGHSSVVMAEGNLASVYHQLHEAARAVPLWEHALGIPVDFTDGDAALVSRALEFGADLVAVGRPADALATFDGVLATNVVSAPRRVLALRGRAQAQRALGREAEALASEALAAAVPTP